MCVLLLVIVVILLVTYPMQLAIISLENFYTKKDLLKWFIPGMLVWEVATDIIYRFNNSPWDSKNDKIIGHQQKEGK